MKITSAGVDLIARWEGLHRQRGDLVYPYLDTLPTSPIWTQGYGFTRIKGQRVTAKSPPLTHDQCKEILHDEIAHVYAPQVKRALRVVLPDDSFSALVSFCFNLGIGNLRSSTLLRHINDGNYSDAQYQFSRWNKAGGRVYRGLTLRREAEGNLFVKGLEQQTSKTPEQIPSTLVSKRFAALTSWQLKSYVAKRYHFSVPVCSL